MMAVTDQKLRIEAIAKLGQARARPRRSQHFNTIVASNDLAGLLPALCNTLCYRFESFEQRQVVKVSGNKARAIRIKRHPVSHG
jgi:hypothetical protein